MGLQRLVGMASILCALLGALSGAGIDAVATAVAAEPVRFTLLYAQGTTDLTETQGRGGLARLAGLIRRERADGRTVLALHGGQTLAPSALAFYDQGAHIIDLLNGVGIDAMAAMNREFHHGDDRLMTRAFEAGFPIVSTNALDRNSGGPLEGLENAVVLKAGPYRIGILAGTPTRIQESGRLQRTRLADPVAAVAEKAAALKADGVDLTVAMTGNSGDTHRAMIAARPADIVLYQDRGRPFGVEYDGAFLSATVDPQATWVLALDIAIERREGSGGSRRVVWTPSIRIIDTATVPPDPTVELRTKVYAARLDGLLGMEVGRLDDGLDTRREAVRSGENAFANALVDTLRSALEADVALVNGGGIRGDRQYAAGTVLTRRDIYGELPYHDVAVVLEVTGRQLREAVESGVSGIEQLQGRFPHLSNARVVIDPGKPAGQRVVELSVGGRPVDPAARYRLATSSFLAGGGDGYTGLATAPRLVEDRDGDFVSTLLIAHIARTGLFTARLDGRMVVKR